MERVLSRLDTYEVYLFFFFNDTATTEIYTLSLHDALPIFGPDGLHADELQEQVALLLGGEAVEQQRVVAADEVRVDRKSTRLNSSHANISYAVFCLKKQTRRQA